MKKIPETDAIFENVSKQNQASDRNSQSLRISIDTKAKVKIGNLSRGGQSRTRTLLEWFNFRFDRDGSRVKQGLAGEDDRPRYGLPFAGDNNYLFDRIDCLNELSIYTCPNPRLG